MTRTWNRPGFRSLAALSLFAGAALFADDGALDTTFSLDGRATYTWDVASARARAVAALPDGSILVGGSAGTAGNTTDFAVVRYNRLGDVDLTWGILGTQLIPIDVQNVIQDDLESIVLDAQGRAVLLGTTGASGGATLPALVRLTADGHVDGTFGSGGIAVASYPFASYKNTWGTTSHEDGYLFVGNCGACAPGSAAGFFLYHATDTGDPDTSFGTSGWLGIASGGTAGYNAWEVASQPDGKILLAATHRASGQLEVRLYRRLANGAEDPSFGGGDGLATFSPADTTLNPSQIVVDPVDGSIYLGLRNSLEVSGASSGTVVRLSSTGVFDSDYGYPDLALEEGSTVDNIALSSDRRIFAVGRINANGAQTGGFFFARLLATGAFDDSFDANGVKRVEIDLVANGLDGGLALTLSGGRPVAAGFAANSEGGSSFAVVRLENALVFSDGFERGNTHSWSSANP
ncbi:MAG: hypothetical protein AB7G12_01315 [Thermoanaerobaculia bacterium]